MIRERTLGRYVVPPLIFAIAGIPAATMGLTLELLPVKDSTIYEPLIFNPTSSEANRSNGAGDFIFTGKSLEAGGSGLIRRGLIAFDLAASVPAGSTITDATLRLYLSQTRPAGGQPGFLSTDVSLHRLLSPWGEGASDAPQQEGGGANAQPGDATWHHTFFDEGTWIQPGGDFLGDPSATTLVGERLAFYTWGGSGLVADLQFWLESPAEDFGWFIIGDESAGGTAKRFDSRESFNDDFSTGLRTLPLLTVEYTAIPEPGTAILLVFGSLWLVALMRIRRS